MITLVNNTNRTTSTPRVVTVKWLDESGETRGVQLFPTGNHQGEVVPAKPESVPESALKHPATQKLLAAGDVKQVV